MTAPRSPHASGGRRGWTQPARALAVAAAAAALILLAPGAHAADGDAGYQGPSHSGAGSDPTGSKPESKLWWNDGHWWASMWHTASGDFHIFRLDALTQTWVDTGVALDNRSSTRADALWDGTKLYVASHAFGTTASSGFPARLYRYSYDPAIDRYSLDAGFPATINNYKTETLVVDKDSTGRLWATWVQGTDVYVSHTVGDDRTWATPFVLPAEGARGLSADDISTVVAFGGSKVGVMWSNQKTPAFHFAVHLDGQPPTRWQATETALGGPLNVDDHVNAKAHSDGRVFAAVRTSQTTSTAPLTLLLDRSPAGVWTRRTFGLKSDGHGRAIVLVDEASGKLRMFATAPETGGTVFEKASLVDDLGFGAGLGTPFLRNVLSASMNDATSTKQSLDRSTGLAVLASHKSTSRYWHNYEPPAGGSPPALAAGFTGSPTSGQAPLRVDFTDRSTGLPVSWSWDFGDGTTSSERNPSHTYTEGGSYTVTLTVTDADGNSSTRTRNAYVTVLPLTADFSGTPTSGRVPLTVAFSDATQGSPTSWEWDFGDGATSSERNPTHVYTKAGTYTVTLTVRDAFGKTSTRTRTAYVTALPLTADFSGAPTSGAAPLSVAFKDTTLGTPTAWRWDLGDGTASSERNPTHVYAKPGTYTVTLTVTDAAGNTSTKERPGYVSALPLTADFAATPTAGSAPLTVRFSDASIGSPTRWEWDFGDSTRPSTERNPVHTYARPGSYTVTLRVWDAKGDTSAKTRAGYVVASADTIVKPATDNYVKSTSATTNYGTATTVRVKNGGTAESYRSYLSFAVPPLAGPVTAAKLRLYVTDASTYGGHVYRVEQPWTESGLTWSNAPPVWGSAVGSLGNVALNTWVEAGLLAGGFGAGGATHRFAMQQDTLGGSAYYSSKEGGKAPELVLTVDFGTGNRVPVAGDDAVAAMENVAASVDVLANDAPGPPDEASQRLVVDAVTVAPGHGSASVITDGPDAGRVRYVPDQGYRGPDTFGYRVCDDGAPNLCDTATVSVDVAATNDDPIVRNDTASTEEDTSAAIAVLANDEPGPPDESGQSLAVDAITGAPAHGTAEVVTEGADAGKVRYTPAADYNGPDSFGYRACDDDATSRCASATVAVEVTPVNDAPRAAADRATGSEDAAVTVDVLANDAPGPANESGQTLTLDAIVSAPASGGAEITAGGALRYTPAPEFAGSDSFAYRVCDGGNPSRCETASVDVQVEAVNDAPIARDDAAATDEDSEAVVDVMTNDAPGPANESLQSLAVEAITVRPEHGTAEVIRAGADAGKVRFVPAAEYRGPDSFAYRVCDGGEPPLCASATVALTVREVNDPPRARDDSAATVEEQPVSISVLPNDDPGPADEAAQALSFDGVVTGPQHGTVELPTEGAELRYVPPPDHHGSDSFGYRVCDDGVPAACSTATVTVEVAPVNDPPVAVDDSATAPEGGTATIDVLANDQAGPGSEAGEVVTLAAVTVPPAHGSAGVVTEGPDAGTVRYTAAGGYFGADAFTYRVCDAPGRCATATASVTLTISASVETFPVPHIGEAADDPAIWRNPQDPARSTIIGTDKRGGLAVYDLAGAQVDYRADGRMNNVDLRSGVSLGGAPATIVAASNMDTDSIAVYGVDPPTGRLQNVAARKITTGFEPYGLCMYRSSADARLYAFVTSRAVAPLGYSEVEQWELFEGPAGRVDAQLVREFSVASEAEGCVADDELGRLYVAEKEVGIWRYAAEPDAGVEPVLVDSTGASGQLDADVEGLAISYGPDGGGYLFASSQGDNSYAVYRRAGDNDHVRSFKVREGGAIDGTEASDGIDVATGGLGPSFPHGLFVADDGVNGLDNQNYKLVPLDAILGSEADRTASCTRPYADSSPWNTPIGGAPGYDPDSEAHVAALEGLFTSDPDQYTYPVYEVSADTPVETVTVSGWYSEVSGGGSTLTNHRRGTFQMPLPGGARAAAGNDAQIIVVDPATGDEWGASHLEQGPSGEWTAWNAYRYNTSWSAVPPRDASDRPFFARGAGLPYLAGLVRPCEIARGRIDHALAFAYDYPTEEFVSPATKSDGNAWDGVEDELDSHPGDMPEGARLQLDPSLTDAQIRAWGCTGPCLVIARALQEYGMYVIDNAGRPKVTLEFEGTALWDGRVDEDTVGAIPLNRFKLLDLPG